jgi:hypothetical protein
MAFGWRGASALCACVKEEAEGNTAVILDKR